MGKVLAFFALGVYPALWAFSRPTHLQLMPTVRLHAFFLKYAVRNSRVFEDRVPPTALAVQVACQVHGSEV